MAVDDQTETERIERALEGVNAGYIAEMQERWLRDPSSVDSEWRALFEPAIAPPAEAASAEAVVEAGRAAAPAAPAPPAPAAPAEAPAPRAEAPALPAGATPLRGPAARLARNMTASLAVPTATSFRDIQVGTLEARRHELLAQLAPRRV